MTIGLWFALALCLVAGLIVGRLSGVGHRGIDARWARFLLSGPFLFSLIFMLLFLVGHLITELQVLGSTTSSIFSLKTLSLVLKEFFFACFIALFIIITVEVVSRKEQAEYVEKATDLAQRSVFEAVYKNRIDPAIFKEVEAIIYRTPLIREKHERSMEIIQIDGCSDCVLVKMTQRYVVVNVTDSIQSVTPTIYIPVTNNPLYSRSGITYVNIDGEVDKSSSYPIDAGTPSGVDEIAKCSSIVDGGVEKSFVFPPVKLAPRSRATVEIRYVLAKDISDNEVLTFLQPTLRGSCTVTTNIDGLTIGAISMHRGQLVPAIANGSNSKFKSWTFENPVLPYQGYTVFWMPTNRPPYIGCDGVVSETGT